MANWFANVLYPSYNVEKKAFVTGLDPAMWQCYKNERCINLGCIEVRCCRFMCDYTSSLSHRTFTIKNTCTSTIIHTHWIGLDGFNMIFSVCQVHATIMAGFTWPESTISADFSPLIFISPFRSGIWKFSGCNGVSVVPVSVKLGSEKTKEIEVFLKM